MLSSKARYGLRAMAVLGAYAPNADLVAVDQIAEQEGLTERFRERLETGMLVASIGPTCTEALLDQGFPVHVEANPPKMGQLVKAAAEAWQSRAHGESS